MFTFVCVFFFLTRCNFNTASFLSLCVYFVDRLVLITVAICYLEIFVTFLPRCMEFRRGLAMSFLSVCLSNECMRQNGRKIYQILYHAKENLV